MSSDAIVVIVNAGSGGGNDAALVDRLADHFKSAGLHAEIELAHGGDGTVSTVAATLVDTGIVFGVLPLGTLNHFAKDLGIPLELDGAVAVLAHGEAAPVDVGEVNGRIFVNNSGLGLYPDIVHDRERQQKRLGRGKWPAFAWAMLAALRRYPFLGVTLVIDGKEVLRRTPFVFIGNNEYRMEGFAIGERSGMEDGLLSLYVAQRPGRWRLLQLAIRALTGRLRQARDFDAILATEIVVQSKKKRLRVAADGEVTVMTPPLHYRVRPASLVVMRPRIDPAP